MRIANTICISQKKLYVRMLILLLQFSRKIPKLPRVLNSNQGRPRVGSAQIKIRCLRIEGKRGEDPKFRLFCGRHFFCFSLSLHSLLFQTIFHFYFFCMLSKRDNHYFKKRQGRKNLKINLKMHHTQVSFGEKKYEIN